MIERSAGFWMVQPLRKYAAFGGRARRAEYWWFYLLSLIVSGAASAADLVTKTEFAGAVVTFGLIIPTIAVTARRLHDVDRSGWWMVSPVAGIPLFAAALAVGGGGFTGKPVATGLLVLGALVFMGLGLLLFVWNCTAGTDGPNRFGEDPMRFPDVAEVFD